MGSVCIEASGSRRSPFFLIAFDNFSFFFTFLLPFSFSENKFPQFRATRTRDWERAYCFERCIFLYLFISFFRVDRLPNGARFNFLGEISLMASAAFLAGGFLFLFVLFCFRRSSETTREQREEPTEANKATPTVATNSQSRDPMWVVVHGETHENRAARSPLSTRRARTLWSSSVMDGLRGNAGRRSQVCQKGALMDLSKKIQCLCVPLCVRLL